MLNLPNGHVYLFVGATTRTGKYSIQQEYAGSSDQEMQQWFAQHRAQPVHRGAADIAYGVYQIGDV